MHVKYMYVKYVMYSLLGLLDRCTSIGNGMGLCLYIAYVHLDRIVLVLVSICMNMHVWTSVTYVLCERFAHIYVYTHMNDDLGNKGALKVCSSVS